MAVTNVTKVTVKPERLDEFKTYYKTLLPDTRAYDGCQQLEVYEDQDEPGNLFFVHRWDSQEHYQKYYAWCTATGVTEVVKPFLVGFTMAACDKLNI